MVLILPIVYIYSCNRDQKGVTIANYKFPDSLSALGFFKGKIADLQPDSGIVHYELSATLFTDYAEKQRLIKLPKGKKLRINGDGLAIFPEGTMIAKTFFYSKTALHKSRQIIETRILVLHKGKWSAGTYKWNSSQTEAKYTITGGIVPVGIADAKGQVQAINYRIPSSADCQTCHRSLDEIVPIGPKGMNLNRMVKYDQKQVNQLVLFKRLNVLESGVDPDKISRLPDYHNTSEALEHRARAYLEINCAHCHNPKGFAFRQSILLGYEVPFKQSGIAFNKGNIVDRMSAMGPFHMPKLGTTVLDTAGVELIRQYTVGLPK